MGRPELEAPPKEELYEQYYGEMNTGPELAEEYDVSYQTLIKWFNEYDIERRGSGSCPPYKQFDGGPSDVGTYLKSHPDHLIRFLVSQSVSAYILVYDRGDYYLTRRKSNANTVDPTGDLIQSYFDAYDVQVVPKSFYERDFTF